MARAVVFLCVAFLAPFGGWDQGPAWDSPDGGEVLVMPEDYEWRVTADNPPRDAGQREVAKKSREDPCAVQEKQIQERKAWLAKRARDQATRGGPDPYTGVPNFTGIHCAQHPADAQCRLVPPPASLDPA